jgi:hypothetical protein
MTDEQKNKREQWAFAFAMLRQRMLRLIELYGDILKMSDKLSADENAQMMEVLKSQAEISQGVGETTKAAPNDDELYDQLLASTDRFREETDRR